MGPGGLNIFVPRTICVILLIAIVGLLLLPLFRGVRAKRALRKAGGAEP